MRKDEGEGEERDDRGQVEDGAIDGHLWQRLVHRQGQPHRHDHPDRHRQRRVVERVVERRPEELVVEEVPVVAETDPLRLTESGVVGEADAQGIEDRVDQKGEEAEDPRTDEEETDDEVAALLAGEAETVQRTRPDGRRALHQSPPLSGAGSGGLSAGDRPRRPGMSAGRRESSHQAISIGQNPSRSGWTRSLTVASAAAGSSWFR